MSDDLICEDRWGSSVEIYNQKTLEINNIEEQDKGKQNDRHLICEY